MKLRHLLFFMMFSVFASAQTVVDIIVNSEDHNTLEAAVIAAGLDGTLSGDGPFTVFAPTDDAFAALPEGTVDALLADPQGALTDILLYHAVSGTALSTDLSDGQMVTTINGNDVTVTINMDGVFINDAQVTVVDLAATNGVVHVIDAVLLPPAQVDLPINFDENVNYALADFGNNISAIVEDPTDAENMVVQSTKPDNAELWAGTTAGGDGLASPIPFTEDETKMTVRVWSPTAGTPILLKVEDAEDPTISVETITNTSVAMQWETLEFDFNNEATGTAAINLDNTYDKVSIFFNFGTDGMTAGEQTYFWDDVEFGPRVSVVDVVVNSPDHNTLEAAVIAADLAGTLSGNGPFTLFAPTDDAFAAIGQETIDALLADPTGALTDILLYHAVAGKALSTDLSDGQAITTINGKDVTVTINMDGVFINDAQVTVADIETDNGVVHVIDAVLIPASNTVVDIVVNSEDHNTLEAAVIAADLAGTLSGDGPFTLFAPTDDAFAALGQETIDALLADPSGDLTDILLYHAVAGTALSTDLSDGQTITTINGKDVTVTINMDGVFINDAQVTVADIEADNGVVHVINAVLLPPPSTTIVDIVVNSEDHNILEAAVIAADLAGTLSGDGPFTLFAPTDDAFNALGQETIDALLADPSGDLTDILLYHAVSGTALSTDLTDGQTITTINGKDVTVTINMDGVFINDAQVTVADIEADNGVVHVINAVLLPPPPSVFDIIKDSPDHTILEAAIIAAGLDGTLSGGGPFTIFAPNDAAFNELGQATIDALLADPSGALTTILQYHVSSGAIGSGDLSDRLIGTAINGFDYLINVNGNGAFVNDNQISVTDLEGTNGLVHVIDGVLIPSTTASVIANSPDFSILAEALIGTGLINALNDLDTETTLFAPSNGAFVNLPTDILESLADDPEGKLTNALLYHVTAGRTFGDELSDGQMLTTLLGETADITINADGVFINNAQIVVTDFFTGNGLIHIIDAVLLPAPTTVMDVIIQSEAHNTLQAAIEAAGLSETLQGEGTFTVFAPTDDAFAALPAGTVEALLEDPQGALTDVLLYHVLGSVVLSTDLSDGASATTLNGADVSVSIVDGKVFINDAEVVVADIQTDNGVVHVIDMVLLPPVSTNEIAPTEATVYPNPANDKITIEFVEEIFDNPTLTMVNADGQLVKSIPNFRSNSTLNIDDLQNGIYALIITDGTNVLTKRITKIQ